MTDESVTSRIEALVAEEHGLRARESEDATDEGRLGDDRARLETIQVELDRCWDLLRQRRAARAAGLDPAGVEARDADTVEHYLQ